MTPAFGTRRYWLSYQTWFGSDIVRQVQKSVEQVTLSSGGVPIHLDVHTASGHHEPIRGTIVFSHGIAGYGRLIAPFAVRLRAQGFHVICPDLMGYGFSDGLRGDWTWDHLVQNLLDALEYASSRFDGPLFLAGASMGGTLAYHAACRRRDLAGLAAYCLFDYREREFLREMAGAGPFTPLLLGAVRAGAALAPRLRIAAGWVARYRHVAEDPTFVRMLRADPCAGNLVSLRAVASMLDAVPDTEYERFEIPTIVLQPEADQMIHPKWSRMFYSRLGCRKQSYQPVGQERDLHVII